MVERRYSDIALVRKCLNFVCPLTISRKRVKGVDCRAAVRSVTSSGDDASLLSSLRVDGSNWMLLKYVL